MTCDRPRQEGEGKNLLSDTRRAASYLAGKRLRSPIWTAEAFSESGAAVAAVTPTLPINMNSGYPTQVCTRVGGQTSVVLPASCRSLQSEDKPIEHEPDAACPMPLDCPHAAAWGVADRGVASCLISSSARQLASEP